jgi:hypothetical protein
MTTLNRALYSGLDFDTIGDDLRAQLQVKYAADFNDFAIASLGIMLLDLTAFGLDALSFYLDRRATDTYLVTARTRKSVSRASRQLGYKMGGAVASSVDLEVNTETTYAFNVTIPEGFQFDGPDGLIFEAAESVTFTPAEQGATLAPKIIPAFEGETISESFVSDGSSSQVFELRLVPTDKFVVEGTVSALVDGLPWDVVELLEFGATDQFEVGFNDEPPTVRFGDGISGNIPTSGATIEVTYLASRGKAGQVAAGTITEETAPLVVGFTTIPLVINNPEGSAGGDDRETLSSAKTFAPKVWKSRNVTVTGEDYEALAGSYADPLFGRVAVAKAISARSAAGDLTIQNYVGDISDAADLLIAALGTSSAAITAALALLDPEVTNINSEATSIASHTSQIQTRASSITTSTRSIKNSAAEIAVDAVDIQDLVTNGKAAVDAVGPSGTGDLSASQVSTINAFFDLINSEAGDINTAAAGTITSLADTVLDDSAEARRLVVEEIGADTVTADTDLNDIVLSTAIIATQSAAIAAVDTTLTTESANLTAAIDTAAEGIDDHLNSILSNDCKANLVTVPILARDAGGFYRAPTLGLTNSLQNYLDTRKEVTQSVAVTSGERFLIPAVVTTRIGVLENFSEAVIKTAAEAAIQGVLRDRAFGDSLYESDIDEVVLAIDGVDFVNARIVGHLDTDGVTVLTTRLDADSNLIILESEVITLGTITISTEAVTTT